MSGDLGSIMMYIEVRIRCSQPPDRAFFGSLETLNHEPKGPIAEPPQKQQPTWSKAAALARDWKLTQLAKRLEDLASG